MTAMQGALSAAERSMRSVFVGNIPYEATEEQLKDIFSEVGPVVSFRLVYDRETGKPKGYGFCEYKDQEMALSAMRNLNGYELNGRALRVDNAASEKSKEELKNLQASLGGPPVESPFGPEVSPEKAPECVSKVVASLPPEQLYELLTQVKVCIENNPNEARTLLIQNPQLSYALLQAQVVMKIVDPETAVGMLHRTSGPNGPAAPAGLLPTPDVNQQPSAVPNTQVNPPVSEVPLSFASVMPTGPAAPVTVNPSINVPRTSSVPPSRPSLLGDRPPAMPAPPAPPIGNQFPERDSRAMGDHDLRQPPLIDHDMRPPPMMTVDKDMRQAMADQDFRTLNMPSGMPDSRSFNDARYRNVPRTDVMSNRGPPDVMPNRGPDGMTNRGPDGMTNRGPDGMANRGPDGMANRGPPEGMPNRGQSFDRPRPAAPADVRPGYDGRTVGMSPRMDEPRQPTAPTHTSGPPGRMQPSPRMPSANQGSPHIGTASPNAMASPRPSNPLAAAAAAIAPHDQEKAALIMQVLALTDQQIALLPPEQRQSIMVLKEQIARSQQAS